MEDSVDVRAGPAMGALTNGSPDDPIVARGLRFGYGASREVLRGIDLVMRAGQVTMVLGGSGSGKTTLLRILGGLLKPTTGSVTVLGNNPARRRLDPRIAYVPQQLGLVRSRTALDNVLVGALGRTPLVASLLGHYAQSDRLRSHALLESLGIGEKADTPVHSLSGGERQRVAIARALLHAPRVLLADEFVSQLDAHTSRDILGKVRTMTENGAAAVVTTHELGVALAHADRIVVIRGGEVVLDDAPSSLNELVLMTAIRD